MEREREINSEMEGGREGEREEEREKRERERERMKEIKQNNMKWIRLLPYTSHGTKSLKISRYCNMVQNTLQSHGTKSIEWLKNGIIFLGSVDQDGAL